MRLWYVMYVPGKMELELTPELPAGVFVLGDDWYYNGGCWHIGSGVRVPTGRFGETREFSGPAMVIEAGHFWHLENARLVEDELVAGCLEP